MHKATLVLRQGWCRSLLWPFPSTISKLEALLNHRLLTDALYHRSAVNQVDYNEDIGVLCPDKERTDYFFETPRSILARSPVLERIFASSDFVQGSETFFYFHEDTATCFLAVKFYLEQGPDRFTANKLEIFATTKEISATTKETIKLSNTATIEILLGLHNLASKLELEGLVRITTTVLNALEWKVDAACCMNLAGLVFGQGFFKPAIEDFVLKHVGKNFNELSDAKIWHYIVKELSESKLGVEWAKLEAANKSPRLIVREGKGKERAPAILAMQATHSPIPPAISRDTVHNAFTVGNAAENVATTNTSRPHSIDKARSLLGGLPTDARTGTSRLTDSAEEYASRTPFDNTYKARKVMGMNSDGGGKIAGRRKLSLAQKARIRAARAAERGLKKMMG